MTLKNFVRDPQLLSSETLSIAALEKIKGGNNIHLLLCTSLPLHFCYGRMSIWYSSGLQDEVQALSAKVKNYANYQERFGTSLASARKAE